MDPQTLIAILVGVFTIGGVVAAWVFHAGKWRSEFTGLQREFTAAKAEHRNEIADLKAHYSEMMGQMREDWQRDLQIAHGRIENTRDMFNKHLDDAPDVIRTLTANATMIEAMGARMERIERKLDGMNGHSERLRSDK